MRNLEIIRRYRVPPIISGGYEEGKCCLCSGDGGSWILYDGEGDVFHKFDAVQGQGATIEERRGDGGLKGVHQIQHVTSMGFFFLAKRMGEFFQTRDPLFSDIEELFHCDQGIKKFAVSPDCRRLVILTCKKTVLVLSLPDLECLVVHELSANGNEIEEKSQGSDYDGELVWRTDSHYFAVNVPVLSGNSTKRELGVYNEDGILYSTSNFEEFEINNAALSWQPSGGLLATFGSSPHGKAIIFSELNGLKRSHLPLVNEDEVVAISWNAASDILAVTYTYEAQLWTRSNYVWMLKKTISLQENKSRNKIISCHWDPENSYRIVVSYSSSCIVYDITYKYNSGYSHGSYLTVSWNANKIYCTPFRDNSAPPPYGFLQATVESNVLEVLVSDFWDGFLCVSSCGQLQLFRRENTSLVKIDILSLPEDIPVNEVDGWAWPCQDTLCYTLNGRIWVVKLNFNYASDKYEDLSSRETLKIFDENRIEDTEGLYFNRLHPLHCPNSSNKEADEIICESNKKIIKVNVRTKDVTTVLNISRPINYSRWSALPLQNGLLILIFHDSATRQLFIGISNKPFNDLVRVSGDCTSFFVFSDNLLLTTFHGSLEILDQSTLLGLIEKGDSELSNKFTRKIEKGSVIVSCCVNRLLEPSLILQIIPRGNIETICPRPLLVSTIRLTLRDQSNPTRYEKIMTALRRHRLDYKILINEMMTLEQENCELTLRNSLKMMIDQVKDSHSLVLLVTDLDSDHSDCIQIIKDLLEPVLENESDKLTNMEEAYLASLAKLGRLEEALLSRLIQGESKENRNIVVRRVKFLSYYCDNPDILFDTSLGTYDLSLASLVADCLGKDPKEFIPILDDFSSLQELARKFKIDDKLRRHARAVIHLIRDPSVSHDEIIKYASRYRLFTDAISYAEDESKSDGNESRTLDDLNILTKKIKVAYGRYLEEHTKYREAIILYRGGGEHELAIDCARKCGEWEIAIDIFQSRGGSTEEIRSFCRDLLTVLEGRKDYSGAARLSELFLMDYQKAAEFWMMDHKWMRAKSLMGMLPGFHETLRHKFTEGAVERQEYLVNMTSEVSQHFNRWKVVKAIKAKKALEGGGDEPDQFSVSDADSVSSFSTRSGSSAGSRRSGKSKRKLDRKLHSLKEGSTHEDLALTAHLWNLFEKIQDRVKPESSELIMALWNLNEDKLAKGVGQELDRLLSTCQEAVQEIWATVITNDILEMKYQVPPSSWSASWDRLCLHDTSSKAAKV